MRRILIAVAAAVVLFTVGAFAADLGSVETEDIVSGTNAASACASEVDINFQVAFDQTAGVNDWRVTGATATFAGTGCIGYNAAIVIQHGAAAFLQLPTPVAPPGAQTNVPVIASTPVGNGVAQFTVTGSGPLVKAVSQASVLVDGEDFNGSIATHYDTYR